MNDYQRIYREEFKLLLEKTPQSIFVGLQLWVLSQQSFKKMLLVNSSLFLCRARDLKYTVYFSRLFHRTLLSKKLKKKGGGRRKNKKITKNIVVLRHSEKFCMFRFQKPQNLTSEGHNELTFQIKKKTWPIFEVFFYSNRQKLCKFTKNIHFPSDELILECSPCKSLEFLTIFLTKKIACLS